MNSAVSPSLDRLLPALDVHAHIDPTVTDHQLQSLGNSFIFAVTRSLDEAEQVRRRHDERLLWGIGVHPGVQASIENYDSARFRRALDDFVLVGEIGLDRRVKTDLATEVLHDMVAAAVNARRLCSLHSTGRQGAVLDALGTACDGMILHWFTGSKTQIQTAAECGAFFSVNAGMSDSQLSGLPPDRILPETDFPFTRKAGSARPGDIESLEARLSPLLGKTRDELRQMWYRNLRTAFMAAGCTAEVPSGLRTALLAA